jgi:hypothetical protein
LSPLLISVSKTCFLPQLFFLSQPDPLQSINLKCAISFESPIIDLRLKLDDYKSILLPPKHHCRLVTIQSTNSHQSLITAERRSPNAFVIFAYQSLIMAEEASVLLSSSHVPDLLKVLPLRQQRVRFSSFNLFLIYKWNPTKRSSFKWVLI